MSLISWLQGDHLKSIEKRHTDTEPSAYPIEYQLDSVIWHTHHGPISAEAVPAIYAALDLIGSSVAQLNTIEDTPLLRKPDPFSTRFEFFFETTWSLAWHGDAYWLLTPTERGVDSMQVIPAADVGIEWDDTLKRRLRTYTWLGKEVPSERIRHLRFHPRAGELRGLSPIEAARVTWEGSAASERWGSNLFVDGVPSGVLTAPTLLTGPESDELKKQWDEARRGKRDTAVLSGGMKYEPVELKPSEIQWLEGRASIAQETARIFHIPSDMLEVAIQGGASSITYRNLAEIGADFVQWCLNPYLTIVEQAWASLQGQPSAVSFDTTPLYKESLETRARTLQLLVTSGADPQAAAAECGFDFQVTEKEVPVGTPAI